MFESSANMAKRGITLTDLRVHTKWRYAANGHTAKLEITEVEQLDIKLDSGLSVASEWGQGDKSHTRQRAPGTLRWWYEAAVVMHELDEVMDKSLWIIPGEKADWSMEDICKTGALSRLYGPALATLDGMDDIGREMDNRECEGVHVG